MENFLNNFNFIWFNSYLALVAVLFGWLMSKANSTFAKLWTGAIWLLFLPNTIYILTDVSHLFEDWPKVDNLFRGILIVQYGLFSLVGIFTFIISVYFFQKLLQGKSAGRRKKIQPSTYLAIIFLNFLVGFGVIMGGIERTNSWHLFTDPVRVIEDVVDVLTSQELLLLSIGTGLLANLIYFFLVDTLIGWVRKFIKI